MSAQREVRQVVAGRTRPRDWGRIRLSPRTLRRIVLLAVVPLMGTAIWIVFRGSEVANPLSDAFLAAYLIGTPMLVGLHWWRRRPGNPIGMLLIALGLCFWLVFLRGTDAPLLRNVGVLAEGPLLFLIAYLTLVFPTGRLAGWGERAIASLAAVAAVLIVATALFSLDIRTGGLDSRCLTGCPLNVVTVGPISEPSASLATAGEAAVAVVALGVMILLGLRLVTGS